MSRNEFKGKTILIAVPDYIGLPNRFRKNLEALGFVVFNISSDVNLKIGLKNTLIHLYKKIVLGIKTYKRERKQLLDFFGQLEKLKQQNINQFDFALFIRPDNFSDKLIETVRGHSSKLVAYQWDGMNVYPEAHKKIKFFERFFVFDFNDLKNEKLLPLTNFYFDDINPKENKNDAYFIGNYKADRIELLLNISRKLKDLGLKTSINLYVYSEDQANQVREEPINILSNELTFSENVQNVSQSKIIIDFANNVHSGLSMRPFEALGYKKKLITNNALIKEYDFYRPENIFVIENGNLDGLEKFISTPYKDLPEEIYEKYSFTNWIKYVMDVKPHLPINFPKKL
ncbi:MAG: hypothetical protein REI64_07035 [Pedobacter sp.]|uniref:hypothetical protein n=1 Tax=Pedobacter sp. TaxID=1411316 RepID=UPI002809EA90|nr:hypothetical protein [Pedobacter sp.]MDQ8004539.1 hypothetical protein [Pedobacter sp.]